jgi:LmbE family N-acetylglucosaminyl deacetylase
MDKISLLAIFAHPDDETFRCGGTLALLAQRGVSVHVLTATHGEAGACGEPLLCTQEELPALRERELRCACTALGLDQPHLLDYTDGRLAEVDPKQATAHILTAVRAIRPQVLLTFGPDGLSGHSDHIAIGQWAAEAYARSVGIAALYALAVPRSLAEQLDMRQVHPVPDEQISLGVDIASVWDIKQAAMACHATQLAATPILSAPDAYQRLFFGKEYFILTACRHPDSDFMPTILKEHCL